MGQSKPISESDKAQTHFRELLQKFDTAMLVTHGGTGGPLHARPMAVAETSDDGSIWFISRADSPKVDEIQQDHEIVAVFSEPRKYLSVAGRAELSRDKARVNQLWKESFRPWFDSKDDPNIILIRLKPSEAEYWDNQGAKGLRFALQYASAYVSGKELKGSGDVQQHAKVQL